MMQIHLTDRALHKLAAELDFSVTGLKVLYDTDGCGCAVNGIARVERLDRVFPLEGEAVALDEPVVVLYEIRQEVFFEDQIQLDYLPESGAYILKSDNQTYNAAVTI